MHSGEEPQFRAAMDIALQRIEASLAAGTEMQKAFLEKMGDLV
jgi:hypothetical protein